MTLAVGARINRVQRAVEENLRVVAGEWDAPRSETANAMCYSLLAPGKRVRAVVTVLVADCFGAARRASLVPACAIEMAHAASLILDDLPCMDDAQMRRRRPANHIAFGEDIALLAAFGLLSHAYGLLGNSPDVRPDARLRMVGLLSRSVGLEGLIGGQELDLRGIDGTGDSGSVGDVHARKTGALFVAAAEAGAIVGGASPEATGNVLEFAARLGLAFQTLDDFVDTFSSVAEAGKDIRQDGQRPNMVTMVGRDRALKNLMSQVQRATDAIEPFGDRALPLGHLAQTLVDGAFQLNQPRPVEAAVH